MVGWAARTLTPARVVDPGTGSARFLAAAGRRWPHATLLGVETDPLAAMIGRATLAAAGLAGRAGITLGDYRSLRLAPPAAPLFLGNPARAPPPDPRDEEFAGRRPSRGTSRERPAGRYVPTSWPPRCTRCRAMPGCGHGGRGLDVNYSTLVRSLLLTRSAASRSTCSTPAVPAFAPPALPFRHRLLRPGRRPASLRLRRVARLADLGELAGGTAVPAPVLRTAARWTPLVGPAAPAGGRGRRPAGHVELGELCRVHRGQVTGANRVWVTVGNPSGSPGRFLFRHPRQRAVRRRGCAGNDRAAALRHRSPGRPGGAGPGRARAGHPVPGRGRGGRGGGLLYRLPPHALVAGAAAGARPDPGHLHGAAAARLRAQPRRGPARQHRPRPLPT
jgi:hypothetical protein